MKTTITEKELYLYLADNANIDNNVLDHFGREHNIFESFVDDVLYNVDLFDKALTLEELESLESEIDNCKDNIGSWADSQVDIYNYNLRENAKDFKEEIQEAIDEFGNADTMEQNFMQGQYLAYDRNGYEIIDHILAFIENKKELAD